MHVDKELNGEGKDQSVEFRRWIVGILDVIIFN